LDKYTDDEASADRKYKDKFLEFEAEVAVAADNVGTTRILVRAAKGGPSILCFFGKEWRKELAKRHVGDRNRIRGRCKGRYMPVPTNLGKPGGDSILLWLASCSFPDAVPSSAAEVRADDEKRNAKQDALLAGLKTNSRPIFDCALERLKKELPKR